MSAPEERFELWGDDRPEPPRTAPPPPPPPRIAPRPTPAVTPITPGGSTEGRVLAASGRVPTGDVLAAASRSRTVTEPYTFERPKKKDMRLRAIVSIITFLVSAAVAYNFPDIKDRIFGSGAPSAEEVDATFVPLEHGLTYQTVPEGVMEGVRGLKDANPALDVIEEFDVRGVAKGGQTAGAVMVMSVDPDTLEDGNFRSAFEQGVASTGATIQPVNFAGTPGYTTEFPGVAWAGFMDDDGFVFFVYSPTAATARDVASQLARGNA